MAIIRIAPPIATYDSARFAFQNEIASHTQITNIAMQLTVSAYLSEVLLSKNSNSNHTQSAMTEIIVTVFSNVFFFVPFPIHNITSFLCL